ncbi:MAG: archease [Halobacteria archaeon]|nr:archease [Halobacteria archaeon]
MYELLDHTADVKFRARGGTLEEAFEESVEAFSDIVREGTEVELPEDVDSTEVEISSENPEALLFDFLDRLIYVQDVEGVLVTEAREVGIRERGDDLRLRAVLGTTPITSEMALLDIKGPTYNDMRVETDDDGYVVEAVLDI